jgi:ribosomal protein L29
MREIYSRCFFIKIKDIRQQPDDVLKGMLGQLALELSIERRKIASTGVSSKVFKNREIRRTIAKINTVLKERGKKV